MNLLDLIRLQQRRTFLGQTTRGVGGLALASLLAPRAFAEKKPAADSDKWPGVIRPLHFPAKAKRVIWLCMAGGPSHLETFNHKPKLAEDERQADAGVVHCLAARTGTHFWKHDVKATIVAPPLLVDGKAFIPDTDGIVTVLAVTREKNLIAQNEMEEACHSAPVFNNRVLFLATETKLYAIQDEESKDK